MAKKGKVDWEKIRLEYVTTRCSYRQLSEKYGVAIGNISKVSVREHWKEQRERFVQDVYKKAEEKEKRSQVDRLARLTKATTKAVDVAMKALDDENQFNRYIISEGIGGGATETKEMEFAKVDTKALKELTGVIKDLTALMRDFYNIPTPAQAEAQRIAAERLELERKKAEADNDADMTVNVVLEGDLDTWSK